MKKLYREYSSSENKTKIRIKGYTFLGMAFICGVNRKELKLNRDFWFVFRVPLKEWDKY